MPEIIYDIEQNTDEWFAMRCGSVGGTVINQIAPKGKGYKDALYRMAGEIITGAPAESPTFKHADRGHIYEPIARAAYSLRTGIKVKQCALIKGDRDHTHISPDGLPEGNGLLEIKTRMPSTFLRVKEDNYFPINEKRQMAWGFRVSGAEWYDRVQYCPEFADAGKDGLIIDTIVPRTMVEVNKKKMSISDMMEQLEEVADEFIKDMMALVERSG